MRIAGETSRLILLAIAVLGLLSAARALGFGDGLLLGATPASGLALAAAAVLRWRGAVAAGAGFALAGLVWGLGPAASALDAVAHGLAAWTASLGMRSLARRRAARSRTSDWLIFLAGVCVFTGVVAAGALLGARAGFYGAAGPLRAAMLAAIFEPLGVLTICAPLFSLRETPLVRARPGPALATAALAAALLALLGLLLRLPAGSISPSGSTLMLAIPFCLWIAMQRRSLDGAALSFVASHVALAMLLGALGAITAPEYVTAVVYLNLLVATCQLVHAVNLDRLSALAEVEARKLELEARVAARTARLSAMTEDALAADARKTRFLATVSHEVRTPLNGVLGMAGVVLTADLDPLTRRNVEIIRTSGFHLLDVINRILDFSQLDHAQGFDDSAAFDLREVVDEVLAEARFLPSAEGLTLRAVLPAGLPTRRRGYRQGLRQILTNLVGNAVKFTDTGAVTLTVEGGEGAMVRIEVRDTGVGVPSDELERIFMPFERAERPSARRRGGTGLGLAICAEVVKRMGGRIGVDSAPGSGSIFWIEAPLGLAEPLEPEAAAGNAAPPGFSSTRRSGPRPDPGAPPQGLRPGRPRP